ncbi:MAG TPA: hypothetical protein VFK09_02690 [Gemmatimonadales bacterium]|nr:hypothetical protein [Gemmatimonadales bacterium]
MLAAAGAGAPRPAAGQQVRELGVNGLLTTADPTLVAGGVSGALRASRHFRIALAVVGGRAGGSAAARGELAAHFLTAPRRARGPGLYLAGGVAGVVGPADRGYIVAAIGLEDRPGARSGWMIEAGVGGGLRLMAGWRWRRFPAGWPSR